MSSLVTFELREKYLFILGQGRRDNMASLAEASSLIYAKILETNSNYVLVDYRSTILNVHLNEAFNIVKRYETILPDLKKVTIAAVFKKRDLEFGLYWKEIGLKRGFFIEVFEDMENAETWLLEHTKK